VDAVLTHGPHIDHSSDLKRRDYLERIVVGGFPEAVRRSGRRRAAFFDSYLATLIERDVLELASIERHDNAEVSVLAGAESGREPPRGDRMRGATPDNPREWR
jgi:uncharacterized protein